MPEVIRKSLGSLTKMAPAQATDLDLIRPYLRPGADVKEEDISVNTALLAHDQLDLSSERFTKAYLDRFAQTIVGRSLLEGHDYSKRGQGRWFDAEVRPVPADFKALPPGSMGLFAKFYVDARSQTARDIDLGIVKDVSIGFIPDTLLCDLCGKDAHREHQPGVEYDGKLCTLTYGGDASKVEAVEGSLVWIGCQPGAQVMGQSSPHYQRKMALAAAAQEGDSMQLTEALAEIDRLKAELEASEKHQRTAGKYEAFLRGEISRKTKVKELAATRDEKAAERAASFVQKMSASASIEQLEEMSADLDETLKTVVASKADTSPLDRKDGDEPVKRQPWEPRRIAG